MCLMILLRGTFESYTKLQKLIILFFFQISHSQVCLPLNFMTDVGQATLSLSSGSQAVVSEAFPNSKIYFPSSVPRMAGR